MPRPKRVIVWTVAKGPSPEASREMRDTIAMLLGFINHHQPITKRSPREAQMIDRLLASIDRGESGGFVGLAPWAAAGLVNLASLVRSGAGYVRRCSRCELWFVTEDKRQMACPSPSCKQLRTRERVAAARRRDHEEQRRVHARVKSKAHNQAQRSLQMMRSQGESRHHDKNR
jgi:hypothetical protein